MIGTNVVKRDSLLLKPSAETGNEQNLPMNGDRGISLLPRRASKLPDMIHKGTLRRSEEDYLVVDKTFHSGLLSPVWGLRRSQYYVGADSRIHLKNGAGVVERDIVGKGILKVKICAILLRAPY